MEEIKRGVQEVRVWNASREGKVDEIFKNSFFYPEP